jgi:hypothetical protein
LKCMYISKEVFLSKGSQQERKAWARGLGGIAQQPAGQACTRRSSSPLMFSDRCLMYHRMCDARGGLGQLAALLRV